MNSKKGNESNRCHIIIYIIITVLLCNRRILLHIFICIPTFSDSDNITKDSEVRVKLELAVFSNWILFATSKLLGFVHKGKKIGARNLFNFNLI